MTVDPKALGAAIKKVRMQRGMTQLELAKAARLPKHGPTVSLIEQGKQELPLKTIDAVAKALEIPSGALTVLGVTKTKTKGTTKFVESLQNLTYAVIEAQSGVHKGKVVKSIKKKTPSKKRPSAVKVG